MSPIDPNRLLHSKWTAARPENREKHFVVTACLAGADGRPDRVELEAVYTRRRFTVPWPDLKDQTRWLRGWR